MEYDQNLIRDATSLLRMESRDSGIPAKEIQDGRIIISEKGRAARRRIINTLLTKYPKEQVASAMRLDVENLHTP